MSVETHNTSAPMNPAATDSGATCEQGRCRSWSCPPCLIVWGLAAAMLLINLALEMFR